MTISRYVSLVDIRRRPDAREINRENVEGIKASIQEIGLLSPVIVRHAESGGYELIAGNHRLIAVQELGETEILSIDLTDLDDLKAELAMIDENLRRADPSPSERARQTARRKAIYLELHPETTVGQNQHTRVRQVGEGSEPAQRFTESTAKVTAQSERMVQRDAERGEKVIDEVLDMIRGTKLDTGTYLDKLKRLPPNEQVQAAKRDLSIDRVHAKTERDAKQAENDALREDHASKLPAFVAEREEAKANAIAARKGDVGLSDAERIAELEEAVRVLETENAELKTENKLYSEMKVQFEQGGFDKVIAGKDKVIEGLETRVYRESADKASWMRKAKMWQAEAIKLGYSRNVEIDIETGEVTNG